MDAYLLLFANALNVLNPLNYFHQIHEIHASKNNLTQYIKINDPDLFTAERCTYIDDYLYIIRTNDSLNYGIEGHKVN